jgi:hypothetical protein
LIYPHSTINSSWFYSKERQRITFDAQSATIFDVNFDDFIFGDDSRFDGCVLADVSFKNVDLRSVQKISQTELEMMAVNPRTQHPVSQTRPKSWPQYDSNFEDNDEIPF